MSIFGGKKRKFQLLYERNAPRIYKLAWKLSGFRAGDAQDLCQETFLRAFEAWDHYVDNDRETAWLMQICVNIHREKWRRFQFLNQRIKPHFAETTAQIQADSNPEQHLENLDLTEKVVTAMHTLEPALKDVLVLRHMEDLSTAQTAEIMGIPEGTVRSRLKRAREALMNRLTCPKGDGHEL